MEGVKILPQKNEVDAVEAILESFEDYEDDRAMSKAIVKAVIEQMGLRETYCVVVNDGHPFEFFWPFLYEGDARKFDQTVLGDHPGRHYVFRMHSPARDYERVAENKAKAQERTKHLNWPTTTQEFT